MAYLDLKIHGLNHKLSIILAVLLVILMPLLNSVYRVIPLNYYGLDVGYFITPVVNASVGYYSKMAT